MDNVVDAHPSPAASAPPRGDGRHDAGPVMLAVEHEAPAASGWVLVERFFDEGGDAGIVPAALLHDAAAACASLPGSGPSGSGPAQVSGSARVMIRLRLDRVSARQGVPDGLQGIFTRPGADEALDPRSGLSPDVAYAMCHDDGGAAALAAAWEKPLAQLAAAGLHGVLLAGLDALPQRHLPVLLQRLREALPGLTVVADTARLERDTVRALSAARLDAVTSSLAWWNWRDGWFWDELSALRMAAPVVAPLQSRQGAALRRDVALCRALGLGWITREADLATDAPEAVPAATVLSAPGAPVLVLAAADRDLRYAERARLWFVNARDTAQAVDPAAVLPGLGGMFDWFADGAETRLTPGAALTLPPGAALRYEAARLAEPARPAVSAATAHAAAAWPRIAIEAPAPAVDGGAFAVKRTVGEVLTVEADLICDGHDKLAGVVQWRETALGGNWQEVRLRPLGNDRWQARIPLARLGLHHYRIQAWRDAYATFRDELGKKFEAGVPTSLEIREGVALVEAAQSRHAGAGPAARLDALATALGAADEDAKRSLLLDETTAALMREADDRPFGVFSAEIPVDAERTGASFASWYEIFPRSMSDDGQRHGTFRDVEKHLPRIQAMGFDVLYFPPIHPIGRANRKGPNNTLTPGPDDPGSPYAIGSEAGGHDALHPELGTLEDFLHLREAAAAHGLELAIDFAIQCSPDHPWLKEHKDWFAYRPDGTIRYAENPPKKYQDIVNVDFYAPGAVPGLWLALCNVVLFWAEQGVRLFRVDNPHTKPLPFWQWMIGEVRARYPDAVFLAEAFTRPKVMNRLAKIGFSQSYTYFTWRNTRAELEEYLTQLTQEAPKDFFRPHFFVNTPDINPVFLQTSGRTGHLIRAALAATMSGLWGVYSGFELCDATPLPGKEEYLDSEKYQLRAWDWQRPGNIVAEVTRLNRIRRENPALHGTAGIAFLPSSDPTVLFYEKATADRGNCLLCAVTVDPHGVHDSAIELPLWKWGLPEDAALEIEDLMSGVRFTLRGMRQSLRLTPEMPFILWRVTAAA